MFNWLKSLIKSIVKFIKKIWDKIRPFLAIIALVVMVLAPVLAPWLATLAWPTFLTWVPAGLTALGNAGWIVSGLVGLGVAGAIDPDATNGVVDNVVSVASNAVDGAVSVAAGAVNTASSELLSNPLLWVVGGIALLIFMGHDNNPNAPPQTGA